MPEHIDLHYDLGSPYSYLAIPPELLAWRLGESIP